jgi:uncharacterized GH25 family protein
MQAKLQGAGRVLLASGLALLLAAAPLAAHDFWIVPSACTPAAGSPLALRLRVGPGAGDPVPREPERIKRFALVGPGGEEPVRGVAGTDPAGYARVAAAGLYLVAYASAPTRLDLPAEKFEEYLAQEGLERVSELRRRRGQSATPSREVYSRCAKSLLAVGGGGAGSGYDRALGLDLELVPEKNPYALASGAELPVRLLFHGKPLAGAQVVAILKRQPEERVAARSDAAGRVRLPLAHGGFWLIKAVHMVPTAAGTEVDWESFWASLTFELPGGRAGRAS